MKHLASIRPLWFIPLVTALSLACADGDGVDPAPAAGPQLAGCEVELSEVALYQSVKISLGTGDAPVARRDGEVIAGKPALLRMFLTPTSAEPVDNVTVRLTLASAAGRVTHERSGPVNAASQDEVPGSTLDVNVPAEQLTADTRVAVEIVAPSSCAGAARARLPRDGELALRPRAVGPLRVTLVPLRYEADGSGRLPDTSPAQLQAFRETLLAMYPVPAVELTVRDPVPTAVMVQARTGWADLLDVVRQTRARDRPPEDVYYFGLVAPADTHAQYCGPGCTTGISFTPRSVTPASQASVGLGFAGPLAVEALVHELGHAHGRAHAPCGRPDRPDPGFPYAEALIGVWGYDPRGAGQFRSPERTRDIMSYCGPRWVSDYTYRGLADRSAAVNRREAALVGSRLVDGTASQARGRSLIVDPGGQARWGEAVAEAPPDALPIFAQRLGADGAVLGAIPIRESELADTDERLLWIPEDTGGAQGLALPDGLRVLLPPPGP